MYPIIIFGLLMATWMMLSGKFDVIHLSLGVLCSLLVMRLSSDLLFPERREGFSQRARQVRLLPGYLLWLLKEIVLANVHVLGLALRPTGMAQIKPRVVIFRTRLRTDFAKWVLANSITLTPGTVTIKVNGDHFYVHAISEETARGLRGESDSPSDMENRIAMIYEPEGNH